MYIHSKIWISSLGGILTMALNSFNVVSIGTSNISIIIFGSASFFTGFTIVLLSLILSEVVPAPGIFRRVHLPTLSIFKPRKDSVNTDSTNSDKKSKGASNK